VEHELLLYTCSVSGDGLEIRTKFSLCHVMKTYGGVEVKLHTFLILGSDGHELSASCCNHVTHGERLSRIWWI